MKGQVDGVVEGWRSSPQFDTHILWGNDVHVEEVHRTTGNCLSITNACCQMLFPGLKTDCL